jgi:hypothetical protein
MPAAPPTLSDEAKQQLFQSSSSNVLDEEHPQHPLLYMAVDPKPGTCLIFPSFVPHFVLPCDAHDDGPGEHQRVSVAFNF